MGCIHSNNLIEDEHANIVNPYMFTYSSNVIVSLSNDGVKFDIYVHKLLIIDINTNNYKITLHNLNKKKFKIPKRLSVTLIRNCSVDDHIMGDFRYLEFSTYATKGSIIHQLRNTDNQIYWITHNISVFLNYYINSLATESPMELGIMDDQVIVNQVDIGEYIIDNSEKLLQLQSERAKINSLLGVVSNVAVELLPKLMVI